MTPRRAVAILVGMTLLVFLLALGAAARLTRLIVDDSILDGMHDALERRAWKPAEGGGLVPAQPWNWLYRLVGCSWCTGVWVTAPVFASAAAWGSTSWWTWTAGALTAMYLVGLVSQVSDLLSTWVESHDHV